MGLTWIDHDTIEKPIEQITLGTEDADDIEFTVETLKSKAESDRKANMHKKVVNENSTYIFIIKSIFQKIVLNIYEVQHLRNLLNIL